MTNLSLSAFDQTTLLFFVLAVTGLVRERRIIPFGVVVLGSLITGPLAATIVGGLILWNRIDLGLSRWIQFKDAVGLFFLLIAAIAPEPYQQFSAFFGVILLSLNVSSGQMGMIPALIMLRQYFPHPALIEPVIGGAALYLLVTEIFRWFKVEKFNLWAPLLETACSLAILAEFKDFFQKWSEDSFLIALGSFFIFIFVVGFSWLHFRGTSFWSFISRSRASLSTSLVAGRKFVAPEPFLQEGVVEEEHLSFEGALNRFFILVVLVLFAFGGFILLGKGGFI